MPTREPHPRNTTLDPLLRARRTNGARSPAARWTQTASMGEGLRFKNRKPSLGTTGPEAGRGRSR
jgi:hypothetical protein